MHRFTGFIIVSLFTIGTAFSAEDVRIDISNFESPDDETIEITGGTIQFSLVDDPEFDGVPRHEGERALFGEYDTTGNAYAQTSLQLPEGIDLSGMRELHFYIYFLDGSTPHHNGNFQMRIHTQDGTELGEPQLDGTGEWHHVVLPIDRITSESLTSFSQLNIIWMPGNNNDAAGRFYIDEMYAFRPGNTPGVREEMVYGFNQADASTGYPQGWTIRPDDAVDLLIGDAIVDPSEGADYLESVMPGGWVRPLETIDAKNDYAQWADAIDIAVDVRMSEDYSGSWHNFELVIESSSGGYNAYGIRSVTNKDDWKTVAWDIDMLPHMDAITSPDGWLTISFITQMANPGSGSVYIDNFRVGLATTFVLGERDIAGTAFQGGETFDVSLTATAEGETQDYEIIETVPEGWSVSNISDGGSLDGHTITWTVTLGSGSETVSYTINAPASPSGSVRFSGTVGGIDTRGDESLFYVYPALWDARVEAPFLERDVTLDGLISDSEYEGATTITFDHDTSDGNEAPGVHIFGNEYPASEQNVTFHVFHTADTLYVACDVTDSNLAFNENEEQAWNTDSIEVFLDGNLSRTNDREDGPLGLQATVVGDGHQIGGNNSPTPVEGSGYYYSEDGTVWNYGARERADGTGYVVEYAFNKERILEPNDIDTIGFDILMNDSELGAGERTGKWGFHSTLEDGTVIEAHQDERGWALLRFIGGPVGVTGWMLY